MKKTLLVLTIVLQTAFVHGQKTNFYINESMKIDSTKYIDSAEASKFYTYLIHSPLFWWADLNNCEDRANAASLLLDSWKIPNYKVWIFSGNFLNKDNGSLIEVNGTRWKYHVAAVIPVKNRNHFGLMTIDSATTTNGNTVEAWANAVTDKPSGYYLFTSNTKYLWFGKGKNIGANTFTDQTDKTYQWTIEGLSGFNGASLKGKFQLLKASSKEKITRVKKDFENLKLHPPITP
jgi:hypothetical protein